MSMMMVVWEGSVPEGFEDALIETYQHASQHLPPGIVHTALMRDSEHHDVWRMLSTWESEQVLEDYRMRTTIPAALEMFRAAGVEPTRTISTILGDTGLSH